MTSKPNSNRQHPGTILRDKIIPATGKTKSEIAVLLSISRKQLYNVMDGVCPITLDVAVKLARLFGGSAEFWIMEQARYDMPEAEQKNDVRSIAPLPPKIRKVTAALMEEAL